MEKSLMRIFQVLFIYALAILFYQQSAFSLEAILSGQDKASFKKITSQKSVLSVKALFSGQEREHLNKSNLSHLSDALILNLKSENSFLQIRQQIKKQKLGLSLDLREIEGKTAAINLSSYQWALKNTGESQGVDLDPMIYYKVPGRAGEDLHVGDLFKFRSNEKILVAVLDTGAQVNHPALAKIIQKNPSECRALEKFQSCLKENKRDVCEKIWMDPKNPEVDQDGNGYPLDCSGWSLLSGTNAVGITGSPEMSDYHGHGTHVSGIIAADAKSNSDLRGISQNVSILPVQVVGGGPNEPIKPMSVVMDPHEDKLQRPKRQSFLADMVARGLIYAMNSGARVINFSMGWPQNQDSAFIKEVVQVALSRGIIIVAAAGNDSTRALLFPCAYSGVVCVGASGPDGAIAHYSNYGSGVDVLAPGTHILSTYPEDLRPKRIREVMGYEFLTGTSQATPFVSGLLAEMLARGISRDEAIARIILSARNPLKPLDLIAGTPHAPEKSDGRLLESQLDQKKYILSGNIDFQKALQVKAAPLLVPLSKEKIEIKWNRQDAEFKLRFKIKNLWQQFATNDLKMKISMLKEKTEAIRPEIQGFELRNDVRTGSEWKTNEIKEVLVSLKITDDIPERTRISSEFSLLIELDSGLNKRNFVVDAEMISTLDPQNIDSSVQMIPIAGMPNERTEFIPIDENLDGQFKQDYALASYSENFWKFWLMIQSPSGRYEVSPFAQIKPINKDPESVRVSFLRADNNRYILSIYEDQSAGKDPKPSPQYYFIYDEKMQLLESFSYDSKKAQIPYSESIKWSLIKGKIRPTWLGPGLDPAKVRNPWDIWQDPEDVNETMELRLYYLNENNQLLALNKHQGYELIDILEPTTSQKKEGRVPVLLAQNHGSENLPSYVYDFAVAEFYNGSIQNFKKLDLFANEQVYRNLLDTRVGQVLSLDYEDEVTQGTFWFSEGKLKEQRLSVLMNQTKDFINQSLRALRNKVDAALWVRTVFAGKAGRLRSGAFVVTNSEIQFHDLLSREVVNKSMERYSFFPNSIMINMQFPLTVGDLQQRGKIPALFTTEGSGLSRGVKVTIPQYKNNRLIELSTPARLRLRTESGCKPMENPIWGGKNFASALDYYCADRSGAKMLRIQLDY